MKILFMRNDAKDQVKWRALSWGAYGPITPQMASKMFVVVVVVVMEILFIIC